MVVRKLKVNEELIFEFHQLFVLKNVTPNGFTLMIFLEWLHVISIE